MPIPLYLGLCPKCRTRVALTAKVCPYCHRDFIGNEILRAADEENEREKSSRNLVSQPNSNRPTTEAFDEEGK